MSLDSLTEVTLDQACSINSWSLKTSKMPSPEDQEEATSEHNEVGLKVDRKPFDFGQCDEYLGIAPEAKMLGADIPNRPGDLHEASLQTASPG